MLAATALAVCVAGAVSAAPRIELPRDHFAHPAAGIEWWYTTGVVRGSDGHRYSVFFTLFRRGSTVLPISQVIDLATGARVGRSERLGSAAFAAGRLAVAAAGARLAYEGSADTWTFAASSDGYALKLSAKPAKRYVLHGGGSGVVQESLGGESAYYSATRMAARGSFARGGKQISFTGTAWLDHQWGS